MPLDVNPTYAELMDRHGYIPADHHKPNFFEVDTRKLFDEQGREVPGWCRIARMDTGDTLSVHTDKYQLIPYGPAYEKFDQAIRDAGIETKGMRISTDLTHNGARCFRQYLFPEYTMRIADDDVALRIISFNTYDGSMAQSFQTGFYTFICANTSIHGSDLVSLKMKHIGNGDAMLNFENAVKKLAEGVKTWLDGQGRMIKWGSIGVSPAQVADVMKLIPQASQSLTDMVTARYAASEKPKTLWTLYNVLTAWSTHSDAGQAGFAATRAQREKRIAALVDGPGWSLLEAA